VACWAVLSFVPLTTLALRSEPVVLHDGGVAAGVWQEAKATATTTMAGVYNAPQATRGEETYMAICVACHPRGTYSTAAFRTAWTGRPLGELFDLVKEKMPKNDPASLTPGEYAQVIAYLLKINDAPAGEHELPADSDALKKIQIDLLPRED
jgi:S-disulfanyl-L-cysteine oxidoreductase SoxD